MTNRPRPDAQQTGRGRPWLTIGLAALVLALHGLDAWSLLCLDRFAVASGQLWRLVTGHLVHYGSSHLLWDLVGLLSLGLLFEGDLGPRRMALSLLGGMAAVNLWFFCGQPFGDGELARYCGLSGILNTLLVSGLLASRHRLGKLVTSLALTGSLVKIITEMQVGDALITSTSLPPVPAAHLAGYLAGIITALATIASALPALRLGSAPLVPPAGDHYWR